MEERQHSRIMEINIDRISFLRAGSLGVYDFLTLDSEPVSASRLLRDYFMIYLRL
jgi:hypothetical protein